MMKIRIKYNCKLWDSINGIVIYPYIWVRSPNYLSCPTLIKHELIHIGQIRQDGLIVFGLKYLGWYLWNLIKYQKHYKAYRNIPYEIEAYSRQREPLTIEELGIVKCND